MKVTSNAVRGSDLYLKPGDVLGHEAMGVVEEVGSEGMEAHGGRPVAVARKAIGFVPDALAPKVTDRLAVDRLDALHAAVKGVRRGGRETLVTHHLSLAEAASGYEVFRDKHNGCVKVVLKP